MQKTIALFIVNLLFASGAFSQQIPDSLKKPFTTHPVSFAPVKDAGKISTYKLPADFYTTHLGFFCTKELQIQKTLKLPVFFRLGSLQYCNKLEGKLP